jgi:hypothetical protein
MQAHFRHYILRNFEWCKELLNLMSFDPWNYSLKIWKSVRTPSPKMGAHLGVWSFILSHFPTFLGAWNVTHGLHSWLAPLQALALVASLMLRLWHLLLWDQGLFLQPRHVTTTFSQQQPHRRKNSGNVPFPQYKLWTLIIPIVRFYIVAWIWRQNGTGLWACQVTIITFRPRSSMNGLFHLQLHIIIIIMGPIHFVAIAVGQATFEKNCKILAIIIGMCTYIFP